MFVVGLEKTNNKNDKPYVLVKMSKRKYLKAALTFWVQNKPILTGTHTVMTTGFKLSG